MGSRDVGSRTDTGTRGAAFEDAALQDPEVKKELNATLQARRELGEEYDAALIDSFLEKVDQRIDSAVDRRVRRAVAEQQMMVARGARPARAGANSGSGGDSWGDRFGFGVVSLVLAVPLSGIGAGVSGLPGLLITWAGIVGVNVAQQAHLFGRRGGGPEGRSGRSRDKDDAWED
ncbi:hypothetical protein OK074_8317 [Actinobacteria bacterium OK074]|nr:hypothetical protein OK074_8317 [Actinobacteria bacterium OK074]